MTSGITFTGRTRRIKMQPSNFTTHPYDSILQKSEAETVARNIMVILARTGDIWRELSWKEYQDERKVDGKYADTEYGYFEQVKWVGYSESNARKFSPAWEKVKGEQE